MTTVTNIAESDLREQYDRSGLAPIGISFRMACQSPVILISLIAAIKGRRRTAARQAQWAAIQYQQTQEQA